MINESPKEVKAYWFFTPRTIRDAELLRLLGNHRHEIGLHITNNPYEELRILEENVGKRIRYYTVHGVSRFFARIMWRRWSCKAPSIPGGFPLESFYKFKTLGLDVICYSYPTEHATKIAEKAVANGYVIHIHPIWLFQRGKINYRGAFYGAIRRILGVDEKFETLMLRRKIFFTMARDAGEYEKDIVPTEEFLEKLTQRGADVFTFIERGWCHTLLNPSSHWICEKDNVALLHVTSFEKWWKNVGKKTRNMVRKAEKSSVRTEIVKADEKFAEEVWKIYNETPIRQERGFPHYGVPLDEVKRRVLSSQNCTFIGAYIRDELVGFIQLVYGENIAIISQILSLQKHWDKAINNALIAKAVEICAKVRVHG